MPCISHHYPLAHTLFISYIYIQYIAYHHLSLTSSYQLGWSGQWGCIFTMRSVYVQQSLYQRYQ